VTDGRTNGHTMSANTRASGSPDLTTFLSGVVCHPLAGTFYDKKYLSVKFVVSSSAHYEDMKSNTKCENGVLWGTVTQGHRK